MRIEWTPQSTSLAWSTTVSMSRQSGILGRFARWRNSNKWKCWFDLCISFHIITLSFSWLSCLGVRWFDWCLQSCDRRGPCSLPARRTPLLPACSLIFWRNWWLLLGRRGWSCLGPTRFLLKATLFAFRGLSWVGLQSASQLSYLLLLWASPFHCLWPNLQLFCWAIGSIVLWPCP